MNKINNYINLLLIVVLIVSFASCTESQDATPVDEESNSVNEFIETLIGNSFEVKIEYSDGQENTNLANVLVMKEVFDEFGLSQQSVLNMIRHSVIRAQYQLNHPRTYRLIKNGTAVFVSVSGGKDISIMIKAIGKNAYGVEQEITILDKYDSNGEHDSIMAW